MATSQETRARTAEQIREELEYRQGDPLLLGALADMAEEQGDTRSVEVLRDSILVGGQINSLIELREKLKKEHERQLAKLDQAIRDVRRDCLHPMTKHYSDASGNNDDTTRCLVCGKDLNYGGGYDG